MASQCASTLPPRWWLTFRLISLSERKLPPVILVGFPFDVAALSSLWVGSVWWKHFSGVQKNFFSPRVVVGEKFKAKMRTLSFCEANSPVYFVSKVITVYSLDRLTSWINVGNLFNPVSLSPCLLAPGASALLDCRVRQAQSFDEIHCAQHFVRALLLRLLLRHFVLFHHRQYPLFEIFPFHQLVG